jgi:SulP family sulfate permease
LRNKNLVGSGVLGAVNIECFIKNTARTGVGRSQTKRKSGHEHSAPAATRPALPALAALFGPTLRADFIAGLTVALVLVPQSMAYAQLAGMPPYYGLYAAFLPVMVAALWGSSNQLGTGPVAVVSLLTASTLAPLAAPGSETFIALAIMLALMVGLFQLALGAFKLGVVVNFLSHPVIVGFTNAAAIIIGLSQINKLIGVPMGRSEHFIEDIWGVLSCRPATPICRRWPWARPPSPSCGGLRKWAPKLPGVLIAVALHHHVVLVDRLSSATPPDEHRPRRRRRSPHAARRACPHRAAHRRNERPDRRQGGELKQAAKEHGELGHEAATLNYEVELLKLQLQDREDENRGRNRAIRSIVFERVPGAGGQPDGCMPKARCRQGEQSDGRRWRIARAGKDDIQAGRRRRSGRQGAAGLAFGRPAEDLLGHDRQPALGRHRHFAGRLHGGDFHRQGHRGADQAEDRPEPGADRPGTGQPRRRLTQAFPVSGSFSRSAVNINAGAITGMSSVFTGLFVLLTLLFLTPLLYHLPQAVLAAVIIMAVIGLVNFAAVKHAWQASRHDGVAAIVTFVATWLLRRTSTTASCRRRPGHRPLPVSHHDAARGHPRPPPDGTLRDARLHNLPASDVVTAVRFDGRLYFANVAFFEDAILEAVAANPKARWLLVVGNGINELDASGEEVMHHPGRTAAQQRRHGDLLRPEEAGARRHARHRPVRQRSARRNLRHYRRPLGAGGDQRRDPLPAQGIEGAFLPAAAEMIPAGTSPRMALRPSPAFRHLLR